MMSDKPDQGREIPLAEPVETPPPAPPFERAGRPPAGGRMPEPKLASPAAAPPGKRVTDVAGIFMILAVMLTVLPMLAREQLDHCPNDASRWNTVYFLVEHDTYEYLPEWELPWNGGKGKALDEINAGELDQYIKAGDQYYKAPWDLWGIGPFFTIDMIKIGDSYYSSKPPFLPTILAGVSMGVTRVSGWFLDEPWTWTGESPRPLMRAIVIIVQVIPFLLAVWLLALEVRRQSESPFVRNFCIAVGALGTYLTPYLIALNNHVIAACTTMFAVYAVIRVYYGGRKSWLLFAVAGFFAGFTAGLEVPALLLVSGVLLVLVAKSPIKTLAIALPAALLPIAFSLYTTHLVTGSYAPIPTRFAEEGGPYDYPGSYWRAGPFWPGPSGMDGLDEPKQVYLMHLLIGHHGIFLLTPIFLVALYGLGRHLGGVSRVAVGPLSIALLLAAGAFASRNYQAMQTGTDPPVIHVLQGAVVPLALLFIVSLGMYARPFEGRRPLLALGVLLLTAGLIALYAIRTNNYGGGCQGPRWLFWLIPLWLLMLPAGVQALSRAWIGRAVCYALVAISLFSVYWALPMPRPVSLPEAWLKGSGPWSDSWAHLMMRDLKWIKY